MKTNFNTLAPIAAALSRARNAEFVTNVLTADQLDTLDTVGIEIEDKGSCIWRVCFAADVLNDVRKMLDRSAFDARDLEALTLAALYDRRECLEVIADEYENAVDAVGDIQNEARIAAKNLTSVRVKRGKCYEFVDLYDFDAFESLAECLENEFYKYILLRNNVISWSAAVDSIFDVVRNVADTYEMKSAFIIDRVDEGKFVRYENCGALYFGESHLLTTFSREINEEVIISSVLFRALVRGFRANKLNNTPEYYYL